MLSSRFSQIASTSARPLRNLHTTKPALAVLSQQSKANLLLKRRLAREQLEEARRPHVVLGIRKGEEYKWDNCDLAKILVTSEEIEAAPPLPFPVLEDKPEVTLPKYMGFGIGPRDQHMLFEALPALSAEATLTKAAQSFSGSARMLQPSFLSDTNQRVDNVEAHKANMLAKMVDLRNANAKGIAFENRRRCIAEFSEPGKPDDSGRPEVQAALLTMQIRGLWTHLLRCKKDVANHRSLRILLHKRAKILKYLKKTDADRYDRILERLGLEPESIEGEINVGPALFKA